MRLLVCAAASVLLVSDYALALDDTPTQPTYATPREAVRAGAPVKRQAAAIAVAVALPAALPAALPVKSAAKSPASKRAPAVVLAQEKLSPPPCRDVRCAPELPARVRIGGSP